VYVFSLKDYWGEIAFPLETAVLVWITFGVSLFHIVFPMELLNKKLFKIKDEVTENITFETARLNFPTDYDLENPMTRKIALREHILRMKKHQGDGGATFFGKLLMQNADLANFMSNPEDVFGVKEGEETEQAEFHFDFLDGYADVAKQNQEAMRKTVYAKNEELSNFFAKATESPDSNRKDLARYLLPELMSPKAGNAGTVQPNQEFSPPKAQGSEEKPALMSWLQPQPVQSPAHSQQKEVENVKEEEEMLDLAALNFVAPHYHKNFEECKSRNKSDTSCNIDPADCVEEKEPAAREFVVNRILTNGKGLRE
jgi:DNA repair ATPase RecN